MIQIIIGILILLVLAKVILFVLGVTLSIVWNLLLIALCLLGIAFVAKYLMDLKK